MTLGRPRVVAGELERRLDRLGAGVGEEGAHPVFGRWHRRQAGQPLAEVGVGGEEEVARAVVQDVVDLGVDRRVDLRVGVAGGDDGDAGVEVEEAVAVDVLEHAPAAAAHDERVHAVSDGLVTASSRAMIAAARGPGSSVRRSGAAASAASGGGRVPWRSSS